MHVYLLAPAGPVKLKALLFQDCLHNFWALNDAHQYIVCVNFYFREVVGWFPIHQSNMQVAPLTSLAHMHSASAFITTIENVKNSKHQHAIQVKLRFGNAVPCQKSFGSQRIMTPADFSQYINQTPFILLGWWHYPQFPRCFSNNFPHFWLSINPVPAEGSSAEQWSIWTINIIIVVIVIIIINIIIHMGPEDNFCSTKIS